jgi:hypothetical protein
MPGKQDEEEALFQPMAKNRRSHHQKCQPMSIMGLIILTALLTCAEFHLNEQQLNHRQNLVMLETDEMALTEPRPLPCTAPAVFAFLTGYGLSILVAGSACFGACCAGQFGCLALQAAILDLMIIYPLNLTLWILYRVLTPFRYLWRHFLTWFVVPYVSLFHMHPSFQESDLGKFVLAVPFFFKDVGMGDMYDKPEKAVRLDMRKLVGKVIPNITKCVPDAILTNTLFRLMLGFAMFPLAWWLCDEMYCVPMTTVNEPPKETLEELKREGVEPIDNELNNASEPKDLDVTFVFPKCRFLVEARKTYGDTVLGNKVCRRVCRLMVEEITGKMIGHQWKVEPNMKTMRCTFSITTSSFDPSAESSGNCACSSPALEW